MKFIVAIVLSALLAFAGSLFFDWWIIAVTSFFIGVFIHQRAWLAFLSAFIGVFLLWGIQAFILDYNNHHLLATKVASILPLGGSYLFIILFTAFVGGLVSGLAATTGSFLLKHKSSELNYDDEAFTS